MCLLRNLEGLSLDSNELHGELPSCLANLRKLDVLELQSNMLTGTLDALFQLDGMTVTPTYAQLRLDNNDFSGTIPEAIQYLNDLTVLTLHGNPQLTGSLNALCDGRAMMEITADCANVDCSCCTCY
uniref:Uncharacterized protein n=1 Tax=Craspedostauros australis TaxID=1486917 RepID=A0A7R9ZK36_9STRA|mmetsp:Transcript_12522/g.34516  ORF Transcript_12522/g.34516 Transcript_12522/m.34516 type:complete len:127 (+) Transcript_12522:361-741(+)